MRIPPAIGHNFTEHHMVLTWNELHSRFGFDLKGWKQEFKDYMSNQGRNVTETDCFLAFGTWRINDVLNSILLRPAG
jgi:hypothetical protein